MFSRHSWSFLLVAALLFWAGLVAGISFLEAPLKFTAPGITVPLGLGIGRLVFQALNKVEIGLAVLAIVAAFRLKVPANLVLPLGLLAAVLAAQTLWLLPALDVRALALLAGRTPPASDLHHIYIGAEVFKLLLLLGTANRAFALLSRPAEAWRLRQAA
ncbi:hypothetical protein J7E24_12885 [Hymenobacter sp. ISL-91]|uniref:hypothetical protein n=1 Tax=Hymenobacter sp. ISL-91 TaxID=2819151 RepID=UPI001BECB111|nr:hypothetical protein [Hymenobacter sp. ISL-91]MBT2558686.1 hypothetical protein [Hymenobacter sp. ISL-91]